MEKLCRHSIAILLCICFISPVSNCLARPYDDTPTESKVQSEPAASFFKVSEQKFWNMERQELRSQGVPEDKINEYMGTEPGKAPAAPAIPPDIDPQAAGVIKDYNATWQDTRTQVVSEVENYCQQNDIALTEEQINQVSDSLVGAAPGESLIMVDLPAEANGLDTDVKAAYIFQFRHEDDMMFNRDDTVLLVVFNDGSTTTVDLNLKPEDIAGAKLAGSSVTNPETGEYGYSFDIAYARSTNHFTVDLRRYAGEQTAADAPEASKPLQLPVSQEAASQFGVKNAQLYTQDNKTYIKVDDNDPIPVTLFDGVAIEDLSAAELKVKNGNLIFYAEIPQDNNSMEKTLNIQPRTDTAVVTRISDMPVSEPVEYSGEGTFTDLKRTSRTTANIDDEHHYGIVFTPENSDESVDIGLVYVAYYKGTDCLLQINHSGEENGAVSYIRLSDTDSISAISYNQDEGLIRITRKEKVARADGTGNTIEMRDYYYNVK